MATEVPSSGSAAPAKKGLWDSLSPAEQKKAVTVFLCSLGVTLLVTGRSGGKLLKRTKAADVPRSAAPSAAPKAPAPPPPPAPPRPAPTVGTPAAQTVQESPAPKHASSRRPRPPPASFLHPDALTAPKPRRLLPSFFSLPASSTDPISVLPPSSRPPAPSSYFLPNPTLVARSTAFADELDRADKLHEDGELPSEPAAEAADDGFNPAVYAMKALVIATCLSVGSFAAGIYGLMRYLGVDDAESLALALQHRLPTIFAAHRPTVPDWATPSHSAATSPSPSTTSPSSPEEEAEEMSYWASVKETLDREAEENRRERRGAWEERVRRRALALGGGGGGGGEEGTR